MIGNLEYARINAPELFYRISLADGNARGVSADVRLLSSNQNHSIGDSLDYFTREAWYF